MTPGLALIALLTGIIGLVIGARKGRPVWGFFLGAILSVIGIIVIACVSPDEDTLVRKETERLRVQQEAQRRLDAERGAQVPPGPRQGPG